MHIAFQSDIFDGLTLEGTYHEDEHYISIDPNPPSVHSYPADIVEDAAARCDRLRGVSFPTWGEARTFLIKHFGADAADLDIA